MMTGRPGHGTVEMTGGSSAPHLACTPCDVVSSDFLHRLVGLETEGLLDLQGRPGITSIAGWNLCPVIFGVDLRPSFLRILGSPKSCRLT